MKPASPARLIRAAVIVTSLAALGACMPSPTVPPLPARGPLGANADSGRVLGPRSNVRPYSQVITREAKTRVGMFKTHRVGDNLYFEIPARELNKDMLLVGRYARAAAVDASNPFGAYGGDEFGERTLRWERNGNRVILRSPSFAIMADTALPIYRAVEAGNYAPIIAVFDVAAYGPDSAAVIDVTRLYISGTPEFAAMRGQVDEKRSYIENAVAFPDNVEVEATVTGIPQGFNDVVITPGRSRQAPQRETAQSVVAHWSMVRLPEQPMTPRLSDDRVGFFGVTRTDFGTTQYRSVERNYIARWRLEKKDPTAALSEPVKPIVYYIDPATPDQWKPWIRRAVLEWQPAFERAGFKNAIVPMDPPANDPDWSPDDIRHTVIRWLPSTVENSVGPHVSDPRTGEILNGSIRLFHNILNLQRDWYFTQAGAADPRAQTWPMPDSLMGRLLETVVAHEIGHTLGLYHNFKASSTYPADSLRSATWLHRMGDTPSIMDYARYDYVAQPEDHVALDDLAPRVGPYDTFAIMWGYAPIAGARTPDDERRALDSIARMQDSVPWYRFSHMTEERIDNPDPGDEAEAIGDADAVKSTTYGIRNIKRLMPMLLHVTERGTEDNSDLAEIYDRLVQQWETEVGHVVSVVGGAGMQVKYGSQPGRVFTPVSRARQIEAMHFIEENVFATPRYLLDEAVTSRIEPAGSVSRVTSAQTRVLRDLLDDYRLGRMIEYSGISQRPGDSYGVAEMLGDLRTSIWSELMQPRVTVDLFRRNLQRSYLDQLDEKLNPRPEVVAIRSSLGRRGSNSAEMSDARAAMRAELTTLRGEVDGALGRATDAATRAHLMDSKVEIDRILDPNK